MVKNTNSLPKFDYVEEFKKVCPYYMSIGMSYNEFWYEDVWKAKAYREAYELKKTHQNEMMWLQGAYFYRALLSCLPAMGGMSGGKPEDYIEKPFPITKEQIDEHEKNQQIKNYNAMLNITDKLNSKR